MANKSGINSLGGFVFQIKIFILRALNLNEGNIIEF